MPDQPAYTRNPSTRAVKTSPSETISPISSRPLSSRRVRAASTETRIDRSPRRFGCRPEDRAMKGKLPL